MIIWYISTDSFELNTDNTYAFKYQACYKIQRKKIEIFPSLLSGDFEDTLKYYEWQAVMKIALKNKSQEDSESYNTKELSYNRWYFKLIFLNEYS